ncbi:hypothetical protein [Streptomyces sp. JW3]|uniref:hypothetical protein n=1 Tax=Streptomyces sp. JW3 TaxID=3456955 RepID=UPI003FA4C033
MTDTRTHRRSPVTRGILWFCSAIAALVAAFWAVTATADLALSVGLYGTPGTYRVNACYDTNDSRRKSNYDCYGDFTPADGTSSDSVYVHLEDTGHDYPDGTEFGARQGLEPDTVQRTGWRGLVGEFWQVALALTALCWLAHLGVKPPAQGKQRHNREPSRREKAADRLVGGIVIGGAVSVLALVANLVDSFTA